jgi:hypothetical protein
MVFVAVVLCAKPVLRGFQAALFAVIAVPQQER